MIGYTEARKYGVIHEPEIKYFNLEEDDQILILASDGIWEHMTIQNVAQIAQAHYEIGQAEAAANAIVRRATQLWKDVSIANKIINFIYFVTQNGDEVDDITCVIIFLDRRLIQKNIYTKAQLKLVEEEEQRMQELEEKQKLEK